jgi:alanine-glyoxylate transaminase/serine-glyoxylate transaminase/serine-pyruvate transaminase
MSTEEYFPGLRFLHSPGPTHVPKAVMDALSGQPMDMADPRLESLIEDCEAGLRRVLKTEAAHIFFYAANGHGAWEAVTVNLLAPGQQVLIASTGHFSDYWAEMTEAVGVSVVRTPYREGFPIDPDHVEQALVADKAHAIKAVYIVHTDTASSVTSDVPAIRQAMDRSKHPALLVVDVVATLGAAPFAMDQWGVNVVMGASQKGLMCPPGMAFCAADERAISQTRTTAGMSPRYYWDWIRRLNSAAYLKFCGTPPQNMLMALRAAIALFEREGHEQVLARHRQLAGAVQAAVGVWSTAGVLDFVCQVPAARSVSVTSIAVKGADPDEIRRVVRESYNVSIASGLGPFRGRVFRIGHLGDLSAPMVLGCLAGVEAGLRALSIPIGDGAIEAATRALGSAKL